MSKMKQDIYEKRKNNVPRHSTRRVECMVQRLSSIRRITQLAQDLFGGTLPFPHRTFSSKVLPSHSKVPFPCRRVPEDAIVRL